MVSMKQRSLANWIKALAFDSHKIALVSGPRQCGKTYLGRMLLKERETGAYVNWDQTESRRTWTMNPSALVPAASGHATPLLVLDEIHKERLWKRNLKGLYDTLEKPCDILVTGSARLDVYRKGSDSLFGRHFSFRLHPFSLREMHQADVLKPDQAMEALGQRSLLNHPSAERDLSSMMTYGPFPEPLFGQDARKARLWRRSRETLVVREDLRDLSRLPDLDRIEAMVSLLPVRVASLFSLSSLARDLEAGVATVKRWMTYLKMLYYVFEVKPFTRKIARAILREPKVYLWDYPAIAPPASRFENLVACHLLKTCQFWTDTGEGDFELRFLRNKEKQEIDFLIVRDGQPWLPVEVKYSETTPSPNWYKFLPQLGCDFALQLVHKPHWKMHQLANAKVLVAGAAEALQYFA